jgi:hypothetical protein
LAVLATKANKQNTKRGEEEAAQQQQVASSASSVFLLMLLLGWIHSRSKALGMDRWMHGWPQPIASQCWEKKKGDPIRALYTAI